jgi:hypothetical protein
LLLIVVLRRVCLSISARLINYVTSDGNSQ